MGHKVEQPMIYQYLTVIISELFRNKETSILAYYSNFIKKSDSSHLKSYRISFFNLIVWFSF